MLKNWYVRENVKYVSIILVLPLIYSLIFPPLAQANTNDPLTIERGNEAWEFQGNLQKGADAKSTIKKNDISSLPLAATAHDIARLTDCLMAQNSRHSMSSSFFFL